MTEQDYLNFNVFVAFKTPHGKKQMVGTRLLIAMIYCVPALFLLILGRFSVVSIVFAALLMAGFIYNQLMFNRRMARSVTKYIEKLKTQGKLPYSPFSTVEFTEDGIVENEENSRTEYRYSVIERISITGDAVYIHLDTVRAIILPFSCFEAREQYEAFLGFISTKCPNIVRY